MIKIDHLTHIYHKESTNQEVKALDDVLTSKTTSNDTNFNLELDV